MNCPTCQTESRRFGKNRNGSQRYRCDACPLTFTDGATRPTDRRRLATDKAILALRMILEGNSVRSTERLTDIHRDTIISAMVEAGENCARFLRAVVKDVEVKDVEADELWGFVNCKERTRQRLNHGTDHGDAWCYLAVERTSKLVLTWHVGKRSQDDTWEFAYKLDDATRGQFQLSTDGFTPYRNAIPGVMGERADFAQLVKVYANGQDGSPQARYSPGEVIDTFKVVIRGNPNDDRVCTSHAERMNLNLRMQLRRLTRLTNGHSKKWQNHEAALALYFAYFNFCRVHSTLKTTPAVAAGLTDHVWSLAELLEQAARG